MCLNVFNMLRLWILCTLSKSMLKLLNSTSNITEWCEEVSEWRLCLQPPVGTFIFTHGAACLKTRAAERRRLNRWHFMWLWQQLEEIDLTFLWLENILHFTFYHNMLCIINLLIELVIAGLLLHSPWRTRHMLFIAAESNFILFINFLIILHVKRSLLEDWWTVGSKYFLSKI